MHGIRMIAAATAMVGLLATTCGAAVAQGGPLAPMAIQGWALNETHVADGTTEDRGDVYARRDLAYSYEWFTNDPRLDGLAVWTGNGDRRSGPTMFEVQSAVWTVTNNGGTWIGQGTNLRGTGLGETDTLILVGSGAYEGLTAYLIIEWNFGGGNIRGAVFPADMPPFPEPAAAG